MKKLHEVNFGIALGGICALGAFCLALMAAYLNWGSEAVYVIASLYPGYDASIMGGIFGAIWAFVDCFIAGWIFAWIYNALPTK